MKKFPGTKPEIGKLYEFHIRLYDISSPKVVIKVLKISPPIVQIQTILGYRSGHITNLGTNIFELYATEI